MIVTIGGNQYNATVQSDLSWSVSVPANVLQALGNGELTISASVTNGVGNTGTATHDIVIDANLPGLRVDTVAGDDVVNIIEHGQALVVTGSSTGLAVGAALTVVINGVTYGATVLADGTGASVFLRQMSQTGLRGRSILPSLALILPEPQPASAIRSRSISLPWRLPSTHFPLTM